MSLDTCALRWERLTEHKGKRRNTAEHSGARRNTAEHDGALRNTEEHSGTRRNTTEHGGARQNVTQTYELHKVVCYKRFQLIKRKSTQSFVCYIK